LAVVHDQAEERGGGETERPRDGRESQSFLSSSSFNGVSIYSPHPHYNYIDNIDTASYRRHHPNTSHTPHRQ
jgi:hypothetical protein